MVKLQAQAVAAGGDVRNIKIRVTSDQTAAPVSDEGAAAAAVLNPLLKTTWQNFVSSFDLYAPLTSTTQALLILLLFRHHHHRIHSCPFVTTTPSPFPSETGL
jgi:hypothetical protein